VSGGGRKGGPSDRKESALAVIDGESRTTEEAAGDGRHRLAEIAMNLKPERSLPPVVLGGLWRLAEIALIFVVGAAVYWSYVWPVLGWHPAYAGAIPAITILAAAAVHLAQGYDSHALRSPISYLPRLAAAWTMAFLVAFAAAFFLKLEGVFSRAFIAGWFLTGIAALFAARLALLIVVRRLIAEGRLDRRVAIVGGGDTAERLLRDIAADADSDLGVIGVFDDRHDERSPDVVAGHPKLGTVDDLVEYARHVRLDLVIFALPITAEARILHMLRKLWVLPVDIRLAAHSHRLRFKARTYSYIGSLPVLDMVDKPLGDWNVIVKWLFDRVVGGLLLTMLAPVMLAVAIAVKLGSKGPVLFRQKRYGFNNELIEVFKFRSMYVEMTDAKASRLVTRDDPRVTRVGRFIRKTSLDELPQLFNVVFKGNLSLVGPRPHAVHAKAEQRLYDEVVDGYFARHRVKPGITGLAQIRGWRGETDTEEKIQKRVECDLQYIENWSIWSDVAILAATPFSLLNSENAY
jgi:Undecaprenyl-phosphate glucose phosphotransferase